jgi:hypothetical protein
MAALYRDRAVDIAAIPVPLAARLATSAVNAVTCALDTDDRAMKSDALATLRHFFACPTLRDVAIKALRLKSLSVVAIEAAWDSVEPPYEDDAAATVLDLLRGAGVDITSPGTLEQVITPLTSATTYSLFSAAQTLLDAGADVNGLTRDGALWPLCTAAAAGSDVGTEWLLDRGASLSVANCDGTTIAHVLAPAKFASFADTSAESAVFCGRWLRRVIAAEPSLLETRDGNGNTPLLLAAGAGADVCVTALLELGADIGAADSEGRTALAQASIGSPLPVVRHLIAAGAASATVLPPGSLQARRAARTALVAAIATVRGCGQCCACDGKPSDCSVGLDILRVVLAARVREAVGPDGSSLAI